MNQASILLIHHQGGGGISQFINNWTKQYTGDVYEAFVDTGGLQFQRPNQPSETVSYDSLIERIRTYRIKEVHIHHFWNIQLPSLVHILKELDCPYTVWLHDFYTICPYVFFVNQKGRYCGRPKQEAVCDRCASSGARHSQMKQMLNVVDPTINKWRTVFQQLLAEAKQVISPSESTKAIIHEYFPTIKMEVVPHPLFLNLKIEEPKQPIHQPLRIAFIGNIFYHKGEKEVKSLVTQSFVTKLPCLFYLYGESGRDLKRLNVKNFVQRGSYSSSEHLHTLLTEDKIDFVIIPSICPETFSYTTHESLYLGFPVLCFDLGAQSEIVQKTNGGWVVKAGDSKAMYFKVSHLISHTDEIYQKKTNAYRYHIEMVKSRNDH